MGVGAWPQLHCELLHPGLHDRGLRASSAQLRHHRRQVPGADTGPGTPGQSVARLALPTAVLAYSCSRIVHMDCSCKAAVPTACCCHRPATDLLPAPAFERAWEVAARADSLPAAARTRRRTTAVVRHRLRRRSHGMDPTASQWQTRCTTSRATCTSVMRSPRPPPFPCCRCGVGAARQLFSSAPRRCSSAQARC